MLNKTELNLIERIKGASIECKLEALKVCREELVLFYNTLGVELNLSATKVVVEENKTAEDKIEKEQIKEEKVETKKETTKESKKKYDTTEMTKCGANQGDNELVYLSGDIKQFHGQIRWNNEVKNFIYTPQIYFPVIFGATGEEELEFARNEIIKQIRKRFDKLPSCFNREIPTSQGADVRFYRDFVNKQQLYLTPKFNEDGKDTDIVATGYINKHAFSVRRDGEVRFKHYNYFFRKCGFEKTASKGYDTETMCKDVEKMINVVITRQQAAIKDREEKLEQENNNVKIDKNGNFGFNMHTFEEETTVSNTTTSDDVYEEIKMNWNNKSVEF